MDRRFLTVLGVSLVFALVVSSIFYQMSSQSDGSSGGAEDANVKDMVVAAKALSVGATIKPDDVKVVKIPAAQFPAGAVSNVEEVVDRPVISNILLDEPVHEGRLADRGTGMGLAPIIPEGMRAVSLRVNDVVGVAGFVFPGMRVDVLVTGRPPSGDGSMTSTVLQNILVLSSGQTIEPDAQGKAMSAPTVTLLVTPQQAETLTLAANEGRVQLVLRNGSDQKIAKTSGKKINELYKGAAPKKAAPRPAPVRRPVVARAPVAARPLPPPPDEIVVFRGTQKTVEVVNAARQGNQGSYQ
jgi:pilus assembly protein CpaB